MKHDLMKLIENIGQIKAKFHGVGGQSMPVHNIIYDNAESSLWKKK